jgi:type III secretory pathway component EscU
MGVVLPALLLVFWSLVATAMGAEMNTGRMRRLRTTLLVNGLRLRALTADATASLSALITKPVTTQAVTTAAAATICGYFYHSIQGLKADHKDQKAELKADHTNLKAELKADNKELRAELKADNKELKAELKADSTTIKKGH